MMDTDQHNAALHLEGLQLDGGWTVGTLRTPDPAATGGFFSVSYPVTRADGKAGFLKVVDLAKVFQDLDRMQATLNSYVQERDLLLACAERRMSRVVTAIAHGQFTVPEYFVGQVNYIIFEMASKDIRVALDAADEFDNILRLQMAHDLCIGIQQLHTAAIAHQDLKPSNFLVFDNTPTQDGRGKVADLGRAFQADRFSHVDDLVIPGDRGYAPPEQLYGHLHPEVGVRRYAADLYQLGSLITFIFTSLTMSALLSDHLRNELHWRVSPGSFEDKVTYLEDAHARAVEEIRALLPEAIAEELSEVIRYLTSPNPEKRGHPKNHVGHGNKFSLQRTVTQLDRLVARAAIAAAKKQ